MALFGLEKCLPLFGKWSPFKTTIKYKNMHQFLLNSEILDMPRVTLLKFLCLSLPLALKMQSCLPCAISVHVKTMTFSNFSKHSVILCLTSDDITVAGVPWWPDLSAAVPSAAAGFRGTAEEPSCRLLLGSPTVRPPVTHTSPSNTGTRPTQAAGSTAGRKAGIGGHGLNDIHVTVSYIKPQYMNSKPSLLYIDCVCVTICSLDLRPVRVSESSWTYWSVRLRRLRRCWRSLTQSALQSSLWSRHIWKNWRYEKRYCLGYCCIICV